MNFDGAALVTGASGFMGSHLVEFLASKGVKVRATSRRRKDNSFFHHPNVEFIPSDLTKPETLPRLFEGNIDRVFHLAAICNFSTPYKKLYRTNVKGVEELTSIALRSGVKIFVHVTSTSVYGYYKGVPFKEGAPRDPRDDYGRSKRDGEEILFKRMEEGLPAIIVRPCTVYGPGCNDGAGKVFSRPAPITAIPGNGRQLLSNVRAEDVAGCLEYLSMRDQSVGEVYNIAEDANPTLEEALNLAAKTYGLPPPKIHLPLGLVMATAHVSGLVAKIRGRFPEIESDALKYLRDDYVVDNTKLKATGFELTYPDFKESMQDLERRAKKGL